MSGEAVRWGIVGTGRMAQTMAQEMRTLRAEGIALAGVASGSAERAAEFARSFELPQRDPNLAALCANPGIDAIYIATPHSHHCEAMLTALSAGKAVLCEKPFTLNAAQAQRVFDAARRAHRFVMEAMWTRFLPAIAAVRELVAAGEIGELRLMVGGGAYRPQPQPEHYLLDPNQGGGVLLDAGVYLVSLAAMLLGEPERIEVAGHVGRSGVDEQDALLLQYSSGAAALLYVSLHSRRSPDLEILGTRGRIRIEAPVFKPSRLTLWNEAGTEQVLEYPLRGSGYGYQLLAAQSSIRAGKLQNEVMSWVDTLVVMRSLDAVRAQLGLVYPGE
jgi:predicted dehydrogenase